MALKALKPRMKLEAALVVSAGGDSAGSSAGSEGQSQNEKVKKVQSICLTPKCRFVHSTEICCEYLAKGVCT